ncbi:hypothetical protein VP1G_03038 [Cytospora mali]|uniref:Mid2 domain-containing protein n=1 Tax=Cytospora mali TaxID=578113 RepID=A0A194UV68_CYTMA|nr:hypothetical protein VP1G_03038 [Valsa mali var. pyri (nom. inval.)]
MFALQKSILLATSTAPGVSAVAVHALAEPARLPDLVPGTVQRVVTCTDAKDVFFAFISSHYSYRRKFDGTVFYDHSGDTDNVNYTRDIVKFGAWGGDEDIDSSAVDHTLGNVNIVDEPEAFATTTITIPVSSLLPTSPTITTTASNSIDQPPPVIPTIASHPDTTTTTNTTATNNLNPSLATKLGLGLGIPLLVFLVVIITACIHRRQRTLQKQRLNTQAPPFDFDAPEMAPVSAADIAAYHGEAVRQYRYGRPRSMLWSEWGPAGGGGGGGIQGYYQGYQVPWGGHVVDPMNNPYQYQYQNQQQEEQDPGGTVGNRSSYDGQDHVFQVTTVRVHQPEQAAQENQRHLVRVSGGLNGGYEEVSPLSSSGSGPPYPRVSAMSGT